MELCSSRPYYVSCPPVIVGPTYTAQSQQLSETLPSHVGHFASNLAGGFTIASVPELRIVRGSSRPSSGDPTRRLCSAQVERRAPLKQFAWKPGLGPAMTMREESMKSLASSKCLFEQRLEHQRTLAALQHAASQDNGNAVCGNGTSFDVSDSKANVLELTRFNDVGENGAFSNKPSVAEQITISDEARKTSAQESSFTLPSFESHLVVTPRSAAEMMTTDVCHVSFSRPNQDCDGSWDTDSDTCQRDTPTVATLLNENTSEVNNTSHSSLIPTVLLSSTGLPESTDTLIDGRALQIAVSAVCVCTTPSLYLHGVSNPFLANVKPRVRSAAVSSNVVTDLMAQIFRRTTADLLTTKIDNFSKPDSDQTFVDGFVVRMTQFTDSDQRRETISSTGNSVIAPLSPTTVVDQRVGLSPGFNEVVQVTETDTNTAAGLLASDATAETYSSIVSDCGTSAGNKTTTDELGLRVVLTKHDPLVHSITSVPVTAEEPSNIPTGRHKPVPDNSSSVSWSILENIHSSLVEPIVEPVNQAFPKGILKKRPSSVPVSRYSTVVSSPRLGSGGLDRLGSTTPRDSSSRRDRLDVTVRNQLLHSSLLVRLTTPELTSAKKSVRFVEDLFGNTSSTEANLSSTYRALPQSPRRPREPASVGRRSTRPLSAKVVSSTPPVDPRIKAPRVASAGVLRRTSFARAGQPYSTNFTTRNQIACADETVQVLPLASVRTDTLSAMPPRPSSVQTANDHTKLRDDAPPIGGYQGHEDKTNAKVTSGCSITHILINDIHVERTAANKQVAWHWPKVRSCLGNNHNSTITPAATSTSRYVGDPGLVVHSAPTTPRSVQRHREVMSSHSVVESRLSVNTLLQNVAAVYGVRQPRPSHYAHSYTDNGVVTRLRQHRTVIPGETQPRLTRPSLSTAGLPATIGPSRTGFGEQPTTIAGTTGSNIRLMTPRLTVQPRQSQSSFNVAAAAQQPSIVFCRQTSVPHSSRVGTEQTSTEHGRRVNNGVSQRHTLELQLL